MTTAHAMMATRLTVAGPSHDGLPPVIVITTIGMFPVPLSAVPAAGAGGPFDLLPAPEWAMAQPRIARAWKGLCSSFRQHGRDPRCPSCDRLAVTCKADCMRGPRGTEQLSCQVCERLIVGGGPFVTCAPGHFQCCLACAFSYASQAPEGAQLQDAGGTQRRRGRR